MCHQILDPGIRILILATTPILKAAETANFLFKIDVPALIRYDERRGLNSTPKSRFSSLLAEILVSTYMEGFGRGFSLCEYHAWASTSESGDSRGNTGWINRRSHG
jgi:hypothetical protein